MLTTEQKALLLATINADPEMSSQPLNSDGAHAIAAVFNLPAVPDFIVYKSNVSLDDVGEAFVASGLSTMTGANNDRLVSFALYNSQGVNPARADHRQFFDDVFSPASGASTRAALLALWKRKATRAEKILATGTGTDASPATLGFEGALTIADVESVRG